MPLDAGTLVGPYQIQSLIGAGGMGEVYLERDTTLHRHVAIKVLPAPSPRTANDWQRLEREARALASLNHKNVAIVRGLEKDSSGSGRYNAAVMEYVERIPAQGKPL